MFEKINKNGAFKGRQNHNDRTLPNGKNKNINRTESQRNVTLVAPKFKNKDVYLKTKAEELKSYKADHPECRNRNLKEGSNFCFESVWQGGHDKQLSEPDAVKFLVHAFEEHKKKFKDLEILSAVIHLDEKEPHLHIITSFFDTKRKKWSQRDVMGKGKDYEYYQDWAGEVGEPFGLDRGVSKDRTGAEHQPHLHPRQVHEIKKEMHASKDFQDQVFTEIFNHNLNNEELQRGIREEILEEEKKKSEELKKLDEQIIKKSEQTKLQKEALVDLAMEKINDWLEAGIPKSHILETERKAHEIENHLRDSISDSFMGR